MTTKRPRVIHWIALSIVALLSQTAASEAPEATRPTRLMLGGTWSCGQWVTARRYHRSLSMEGWVIGYLSGLNFAFDASGYNDILANLDPPSAYLWIDTWCNAHPLDDVATAANHLADETSERAGLKGSKAAPKKQQ
jgi:hypothetical protein